MMEKDAIMKDGISLLMRLETGLCSAGSGLGQS